MDDPQGAQDKGFPFLPGREGGLASTAAEVPETLDFQA